MHRRRFLALTSGTALSAGCGQLPFDDGSGPPATREPVATPAPDGDATVTGAVTDLDGDPLADAAVEALRADATVVARDATGASGQFALDAGRAPRWLRVRHPDYLSRVRAVEPGRYAVRLTPAADTVSLALGGDVMFGRRFYERRPDHPAHVDRDAPLAGHEAVLRPLAPVLRNADVASVNLETPLTTSPWRHPTKAYTFPSHPVAADALAGAGVDYAALGNNHAFDALAPGLSDTTAALEAAGVEFSGAGSSSDEAWAPAVVERRGVRVAFVSCTTLVGERYDVDWSADRGASRTHTVSSGSDRVRFSGAVGVAEATEERLRERVAAARETADAVVVQIHGGEEYRREPTERMVALTDAASAAGAAVVANHHPHVTGGLEFRDGTLVAWSLGNLVFDQELWETYRSYLLTVHLAAGGDVRRASVAPVLRDGYVPKGVTGRARRKLVWETAGWSAEEFALTGAGLEFVDGATPDRRRETRTFGGDRVYARESGWAAAVERSAGTVRLGTDRLFTGDFADCVVDGDRAGGTLWRFDRDRHAAGRDASGGVELRPGDEPATLGPSHRVPVDGGPVTLTGRYRTGGDDGPAVDVSWYDGLDVEAGLPASRDPAASERHSLDGTGGRWTRTRLSLDPPTDASYVRFDLETAVPASFDDWRLVDWTTVDDARARGADFLRVDGAATVRFAAAGRGGSGVAWEPVGDGAGPE